MQFQRQAFPLEKLAVPHPGRIRLQRDSDDDTEGAYGRSRYQHVPFLVLSGALISIGSHRRFGKNAVRLLGRVRVLSARFSKTGHARRALVWHSAFLMRIDYGR